MRYDTYDIEYEYNKRSSGSSIYEGQYGVNRIGSDNWTVYHVEWRSQRKIYFLKSINQFGDEQLDIVGEEFQIPEYAEKVTIVTEYGKKKTQYHFD